MPGFKGVLDNYNEESKIEDVKYKLIRKVTINNLTPMNSFIP